MTQSLLSVVVFIALLALLPWAIRKVKQRNGSLPGNLPGSGARFVSALGVGPTQRVVTVEVGPPEARVWLVLGVTAQQITRLHSSPAPGFAQAARLADGAPSTHAVPAAPAAHDYRGPGHA